MPDRLSRLAPLTGLVFAVATVATFVISKNPPDSTAGGAKVLAFYQANRNVQRSSDFLLVLAGIFFLFFAGSLRGHLRRAPAAEVLSAVVLVGAALLMVFITLTSALDYALAADARQLVPAAAQALNVLDNRLFFVAGAGGCVFGIASGLAILRSGQLPKWLGWLAIVIGIVMATPPGLSLAFLALIVWTVVVSLLIWTRSSTATQASTATA